ncbi:MAG: TIR domain-containing protein [Anaerolineaceae bacterium]|nr:TIR domain-containing protein [Anaerolineaceae bacterium]
MPLVQQLRDDLLEAGIEVWIDKVGLTPGTISWEQALRDAIRDADAVLFCASSDSRESRYVRDEISLATAAGKLIFPAWVAGENWLDCVPLGLLGTQYADLRSDSYAAGLSELVAAIRDKATTIAPLTTEEPTTTEVPPDFVPRNPYKGLLAFHEADQQDFFGREALVAHLQAQVENAQRAARLLAVLGASGSGKSSVLMAGLLPQLRETHPNWIFLDPMVPGTQPLENLADVLSRKIKSRSYIAILEDLKDASTRGLHRLAREISEGTVVLYIDQFEEIFTQADNDAESRQFIDLLSTAMTEPNGTLYLLLSMRADFYDRPLQYTPFGKLVETHHAAITPMTLADLYDVIQKPAALPDVRLKFDDGLVTEMVFAVRGEIAALPLLQFTLAQLFERRDGQRLTLDAYRALGGIQGALAQHADATYQNLPSDRHRDSARELFLRLIEPGQTEQDTTRRRATAEELTLPDANQTRILQETADAFVNARLLVGNQTGDTRTLEVSHEALIREWDLLREWIDDNRDALRVRRQLREDTQLWIEQGLAANFLASEGPLAQYRDLLEVKTITITQQERSFVEASIKRHDAAVLARTAELEEKLRIAEERDQQKAQIIEHERRGTETQRKNARRLLVLAAIAVGLFVVALVFALLATDAKQDAERQAATAIAAQEEAGTNAAAAEVNAQRAANNEAVAIANAAAAAAAQEEADTNAAAAEDARVTSEANAAAAAAARQIAEVAATNEAQQAAAAVAAQQEANVNAAVAESAQQRAQTEATNAANSAGTAIANASTAVAAQGTANAEATNAFNNAAAAVAAESSANEQRNIALSRSLAAQAELLLNAGDYQLAMALALEANRIEGAPPDVQRVLSLVAYNGPRRVILNYREDSSVSRSFNTLINCGADYFLIGTQETDVVYWDIANNADSLYPLYNDQSFGVTALACDSSVTTSDNHKGRVASGDTQGTILIRGINGDKTRYTLSMVATIENQAETTTPTATLPALTAPSVLSLAFSPDGGYLVAGYQSVDEQDGIYNARLLLWNVANGEYVRQIIGHNDAVSGVVFLDGGNKMISTSVNGEIILWDTQYLFSDSGEYDILRRVQTGSGINALALNAAEDRIAVAGENGIITIFDTTTLQEEGRLLGHSGAIRSLAYMDYDGNTYLLSGSEDHSLILWDVTNFIELRRLRAHGAGVTGVAFNPDGTNRTYIVSASSDGAVMQWDMTGGAEVTRNRVLDVQKQQGIDLGGSYAVTLAENAVYLWDSSLEQRLHAYTGDNDIAPTSNAQTVAISADGNWVLSGYQDGRVILWSTSQGAREAITSWSAHEKGIDAMAFNPDGSMALTSGEDRHIRLWDVNRTQQVEEDFVDNPDPSDDFEGHTGAVLALAFCCDASDVAPELANRFASGSETGELFLWNINDHTSEQVSAHKAAINAVAFSPDGKILVSASSDNTLIAWDVAVDPVSGESSLKPIGTFRQHTGPVRSVDFSADGKLLISASDDGTVIVWDVATRVPMNVLVGHTSGVNSVRFEDSGNYAVSSGDDGLVIRWRVDERDELNAWIIQDKNRYVPTVDPNTLIHGQNGCEIRFQYGIQPVCVTLEGSEELVLPTATITPVPSYTPTPTPTPTTDLNLTTATPSPMPTMTLTLPSGRASTEDMLTLLKNGIIQNAGYYEAERRDLEVIDLSYKTNAMTWRSFDQTYQNFVAHTRIDWGAGSLRDRCGFAVRFANSDNFYLVQLDPLGNIDFRERSDGSWATPWPDTDPTPVKSLPQTLNILDSAELVVVGQDDDTLTVFIVDSAGEWSESYEFITSSRSIGEVALTSSVLTTSREAGCIFTDSWIVDLDHSSPPPPTSLPATLVPLDYAQNNNPSPADIVAQVTERLNAAAGRGYLSEQSNRLLVDFTGNDANILQSVKVENGQIYSEFITGTTFTFRSDLQTDACGFMFRRANQENFYFIEVNQAGNVTFAHMESGQYKPTQRLSNDAGLVDGQNRLIIAALTEDTDNGLSPSRFVVFVNDHYVGEVTDSSIARGAVFVSASKRLGSATTSGCEFERTWIWNLGADAAPAPPTPQPPQDQGEVVIGEPASGNLPVGGHDRWTFTYDESLGSDLIVSVQAERPADDASSQASIARRLLNVELRITYDNGDTSAEQFIAYGGDIVPGKETDIRLSFHPPHPGTYHLEVYSYADATGGPYTLTIEKAEGN